MRETALALLDGAFHVVHVAIIVFNLFAWLHPRLRRWHLVMVALTLGSWLILGIWYGLGYCFVTDWHWRVMAARGRVQLPSSYTELLAEAVLQRDFSPAIVASWTLWTFVAAIVGSITVNLRAWFRTARTRSKNSSGRNGI